MKSLLERWHPELWYCGVGPSNCEVGWPLHFLTMGRTLLERGTILSYGIVK